MNRGAAGYFGGATSAIQCDRAMSVGGLRSLSVEHFNLTAESAEFNLDKALQALAGTIADVEDKRKFEAEMKGLRMIFKRYMESKGEKIDWGKIKPPSDDLILAHNTLAECSPKHVKELASKLAVLKLNGGLGTTMGCVGPKSVIEVREGQSFLDLIVKQIKVRGTFCASTISFARKIQLAVVIHHLSSTTGSFILLSILCARRTFVWL